MGRGRRSQGTGLLSTTTSHFADEEIEAQRQEETCPLLRSWSGGAARGQQAQSHGPCPTGGRTRRSSMHCPRRPGTPASLLSSLPLTGHLSLPLTRLSALARMKAFGSLLLGSLCPSPLSLSLSSQFLSLLVSSFSVSAFLSAFLSYMAGFPHPPTPARAQSLCDSPSSGLSPVPLSLPSPPRAPSPCTPRPLSPARPSAPTARSQGPGAGTAGLARRPA